MAYQSKHTGAAIDNAIAEHPDIEQQIVDINSQVSQLNTLINNLNTSITNLQNKDTSLTNSISELSNRIIPITNGGTQANNIDDARRNLGCKMDLLWGGGSNWSTGNITLSKPFTDYDIIIMVYSHEGENIRSGNGYVFSTCYPVGVLESIRINNSRFATFGYSSRFRHYAIPNTTTFQSIRNGDSGNTGMIAVYGLKCS